MSLGSEEPMQHWLWPVLQDLGACQAIRQQIFRPPRTWAPSIISGLMVTVALSLCLINAQVQEDLPALGTNLAGFADWSTEWPLVDVFKMARPWVSQKDGAEWGKGEPLEIDENGNVKRLKPGQFAETVIYSNGKHPVGKYTLLWKGKGEFDAHLGSKLTLDSEGKATVDVTGVKGIYLILKAVDPADPPHDIKLIMPGYEETYTEQPFHPVFLQRMSLYRCLRFMDWGATNGSPVTKWADRATPSKAMYTNPTGVPLETMIDLANEKAAMPWFCVPHRADDDYVRQMAKLIKEKLRSDLRIALEYSNECWNGSFEQTKWCIEQGKAQKLSDNDATAGLRFYSKRAVEVFAIFEEVFGGKSRLVRVLSAQAANPKTGEEIVNWKDANLKADALAIAPYFGYSAGSAENAEKTKSGGLDGLFATLSGEIEAEYKPNLTNYATVARKNSLRLIAYEGGQHLVGQGSFQDDPVVNEIFDKANRDERIRDAYLKYLKAWRAAGGSLFMHFTDCGVFSKYGRWGTIEFQDQDPQSSYKNQALIQYALFPDR